MKTLSLQHPNCTFEEFQKQLQHFADSKHKCCICVQNILSLCNLKLNIRKFLTLFVIIHYHENIFSHHSISKLEHALLQHSRIIVRYIFNSSLRTTQQDLKILLQQYELLLSKWLQMDKKGQLEELCDIYYNLPKSFSFNAQLTKQQITSYEEQKNNFRRMIRQHIVKISGKQGLDLLVQYGEKMRKIEHDIKEQINIVMHDTYWKMFQAALEQKPPNYSQVLSCLNEIREQFLFIVGKNIYWQKQINEHLDIPYITQRIEKHTFNSVFLESLITFIFNGIKELGAPVNDNSILECKSKMLLLMQTSKTYAEFLPILFRNIMERMHHLQQSILLIKSIK